MAYAENTTVSVEKSRTELQNILLKYGANGYRYGLEDTETGRRECIEFSCRERVVRFLLQLPSPRERRFAVLPKSGKPRTEAERNRRWEQACRSKWRALVLTVKAKLEACEAGISIFEAEFLSNIVDPLSGRTVGQITLPQLDQRYQGVAGLLGLPAPD